MNKLLLLPFGLILSFSLSSQESTSIPVGMDRILVSTSISWNRQVTNHSSLGTSTLINTTGSEDIDLQTLTFNPTQRYKHVDYKRMMDLMLHYYLDLSNKHQIISGIGYSRFRFIEEGRLTLSLGHAYTIYEKERFHIYVQNTFNSFIKRRRNTEANQSIYQWSAALGLDYRLNPQSGITAALNYRRTLKDHILFREKLGFMGLRLGYSRYM